MNRRFRLLSNTILYHDDQYWGMADNKIDDYEFHKLTHSMQLEHPNARCLNRLNSSIGDTYWEYQLFENIKLQPQIVFETAVDKIALHEQYEGKSFNAMLIDKESYIIRLLLSLGLNNSWKDKIKNRFENEASNLAHEPY